MQFKTKPPITELCSTFKDLVYQIPLPNFSESVLSKVILIKNLKVNEMTKQVLAMQTWSPDFNP